MHQPTLLSERLLLRPFDARDADAVQSLAGEWAIADTTLNIPHPYPDGAAEEWIATHAEAFARGKQAIFAITLRDGFALIGAMGLGIKPVFQRAELGYWISREHWGNGYCTEAARRVLLYGFEDLGLHRIHAVHFSRNPASGRVMQKIGMRKEGVQREHVIKWGRYEDLVLYAILAEDFSS